MNAQYTPGPWHMELVTKTSTQLQATMVVGADNSIWPSFGRTIAEVGHWRDRVNPEADARLIAVAPELLEALDQLLMAVQWLCANVSLTDGEKRSLEVPCQDARFAIAKVEGNLK